MTVFDLVYTPPVTPLIEAARAKGCRTITRYRDVYRAGAGAVLPVLRYRCPGRKSEGARSMNSLGRNFRITTFGESHGAVVGVVIDGCPAGMNLAEQDIQPFLDRRRPGTSPLSLSTTGERPGRDTLRDLRREDYRSTDCTHWSAMRTSTRRITKNSAKNSARAMLISRTRKSTASGTTGAEEGVPGARPSAGSLPVPLP